MRGDQFVTNTVTYRVSAGPLRTTETETCGLCGDELVEDIELDPISSRMIFSRVHLSDNTDICTVA